MESDTYRNAILKFAPAVRASQRRNGRFPVLLFVEEKDCKSCAKKAEAIGLCEIKIEDGADACKNIPETKIVRVKGLGMFLIAEDSPELYSLSSELGMKHEKHNPRKFQAYQRMYGKIALVTGAAQGFGAGIAEELAKAGAHVVIADLNIQLAEQVASAFNAKYGDDTAFAVKVDVSNEESAENMVAETVMKFGGLDLLVCSAGVLRAGGLEQLSLKDFEFVTKINYTSYFICAKYASRPMKIQNSICEESYGDIVEINSKSGLDGSNKNFAYAGGKFGGIGLTQSFAKELVTDRIKVNAVCPGNYYDGPLWSDPERGLFRQYLEAGKVPGAKTVEDVLEFYLSKVPMHKGCNPIDVARAIFYAVEQENETGQAIPVTGGQIMLS